MEKRIAKWQADGLIDAETAAKLLEDVKEDKARMRRSRINITIYTVAVVLLGLGVISFVAANDWIWKLLNASDFLKIFVMLTITCSSLWGGYELAYEKKNFPKLGSALIFLACMLIGGTYALVGQIYNINANSASLCFLWLVSILPVAYLFRNFAVNVISIVLTFLGIIFFYMDLSLDKDLIWSVFIPVLCGLVLYTAGNIPAVLEKFNRFSFSYKISGVLPIFVTLLVLTCSVEHSYHITSAFYLLPLVVLIFVNLGNYLFRQKRTVLLNLETAFLTGLSIFLLLLLVAPQVSTMFVMILANAALIAVITFGFNYGYKFENLSIISMTNWLLTIYLIVTYCRWGWSFMDKTLFFLLGGSVLLALGLFLERQKRKVSSK